MHILVAQEFLGYDAEKQANKNLVIHHIDENKGNPILSNLEIVTLSENHILSPRVSNQNNWGKSIIQLDLDGNFVAQYSSASVAAKAIKGGRSHISRCANGKFSKMYGYRWKFKNEENLENEIWKQIEIDGKIIQISNQGRVNRRGAISYGSMDSSKYRLTNINGKGHRIHRLVCQAFHPIDNPKDFVVNHINHIKDDNRAENLEWTTCSGNTKAFWETIPDISNRNLRRKEVIRIDKIGNIERFESSFAAAKVINGHDTAIHRVCRNKNNHYYGYKWIFASEYDNKNDEEKNQIKNWAEKDDIRKTIRFVGTMGCASPVG